MELLRGLLKIASLIGSILFFIPAMAVALAFLVSGSSALQDDSGMTVLAVLWFISVGVLLHSALMD